MTHTNPAESRSSIFSDPILRLTAIGSLLLGISFFASRAPTSFKGGLPFIGDFIPLELNAVYLVVLGPIAATVLAAYLWYLARARPSGDGTEKGRNVALTGGWFLLFAILTTGLSVQYFLELAPQGLCPTRPHYDFLWTNVPGANRIHHCMSDTDEINASSPFYLQPQIVQSWGHIVWPVLTAFFLFLAWRRMRSTSSA